MAITRITATNTFSKGLIMDFNPMVTKTDCLVNALNATLLTYNGNELQLQQDMGNGRVETAYLPEGYVPVGSCEFGDIIYIVSYNPLENKSQIGCFPSPERNITSDEITDMQQNLTNADFQKMSGSTPTGVLNATSVKKIIYGNKNMNPGDKYIIYEESEGNTDNLSLNSGTLSDYGNTMHQHNEWPKLVKLNVVAIEDSGKIVDLNASVKWYDNDYYLQTMHLTATGENKDLDSYRSLVSSAYSVFQSKVSGKLAILAELEAIDEFSCTYDVYTELCDEKKQTVTWDANSSKDYYTKYKIYFYTSWGSSHNDINPSGFLFTASSWTDVTNGGFVLEPDTKDGDIQDGHITAKWADEQTVVPYESAASGYDEYGKVSSWDCNQVFEYSVLYNLYSQNELFSDYFTKDSYNAQIDDIIDWMKGKDEETQSTQYQAFICEEGETPEEVRENLRTVTSVTRLLNWDTGEPEDRNENKYEYVYNLSYYIRNGENDIYYTKNVKGDKVQLNPIQLTDDVINNYFHKDTPHLITDTFTLLKSKAFKLEDDSYIQASTDLSKMIWNYEVAPVMPYGVLDWLAISGNIDFSKVGSGIIDLVTWRYYNSGNVSTLTWGLDAYPEPNKGIAEVVFDFFDNQGYAASWHITGKSSYAGTFTENIVLDQRNSSYKMNSTPGQAVNEEGDEDLIHAGTIINTDTGTEDSDIVYLDKNNTPTRNSEDSYDGNTYLNDVGTLYASALYLVRITVKYCSKNVLGEYNTEDSSQFKTFYRWYWTNSIFNENYYNVQDFKVLQPRLTLDFSASFDTRGSDTVNQLIPKTIIYQNPNEMTYPATSSQSDVEADLYKTIGANVYEINQDMSDDANGNILLKIEPGLAEGFNSFNLNDNKDYLEKIQVKAYLGKSTITKNIDSPSLIHTGSDHTTELDDVVQPIVMDDEDLCSHNDKKETSGWDRSGYVAYDYGKSGCTTSNYLKYEILGIDPDKTYDYESTEDPRVDQINKDGLNIYEKGSEDTKYTTYEAYRDSFSLNIVNGKYCNEIGEDKYDPQYYDSEGNLVTDITHYQYLDSNLYTLNKEGIGLTLTGIAFSKIFASEVSKDSNSRVLKSMVHSLNSNDTINTLQNTGLRYWSDSSVDNGNGHIYFNNLLIWGMGEGHGDRTRRTWGTVQNMLRETWSGDANDSGIIKAHETWQPSIDNSDVQGDFKHGNVSPVFAFVIGKQLDDGSSNEGKINNTFCDYSWYKIRKAFRVGSNSTSLIHDYQDYVPYARRSKWDGNDWIIHSFAVYDYAQDLVLPICDWFISDYRSQAYFGYRSGAGNYGSDKDIKTFTLADMLGSLFAQLYVVDPSAVADGALIDNFAYPQNYTEYWNKDVIIDTNTEELTQEDINGLITLQMVTMNTYLNHLGTNLPQDMYEIDYEDEKDINIQIDLLFTRRSIAFQYSVPFDLGDILYNYNQLSETHNKIEVISFDKNTYNGSGPELHSFIGSLTENTLYTWSGETAVKFGGGSTIYMADYFSDYDSSELILLHSGTLMKSSSFNTLSKVLQYDGGDINWNNLTQLSHYGQKYYIGWDSTARGADLYLKNIPMCSIFNIYKPGN